jgi:DNA-binding CsgD family transcriptional regulator/PAS domain-containing protein
MTDRYADEEAVSAALYASLLDEEPWAAFLDRLAAAAGANWATLILTPRAGTQPGLILTPGADPGVGLDYTRRLFADDPFTGLPEGRATHFREVVSAQQLDRNADFRAFMARTSSLEVIGVDLREPGGLELRLRLTRAADRPPFEGGDLRRLDQIVPHLRIALRLFDRLATFETEQRIYAGAVAQMAIGLIILNRRGKVLQVNTRAAAILAERDGIALRDDTLMLADADLGRQLHARLSRPDDAALLTLRIERPSGMGDLLLVAGSAHAPDYVSAGGGPAMVLFLNDPTHAPRISPDALRELLGLTQSEAGIAADVADGLSIVDVAARHGISPNTVRAHLRAIFTKTGVKRQSQLVHLVHHSLPGLARPPA